MLEFPKTTMFGHRVPKQKFYEYLDIDPEIKRLFVEQIRLITWINKLSPQTMNIAAGEQVQEIEVFEIKLTGEKLDPRVLTLMDRQIPYHILFLLKRMDGLCQLVVNYKESSQAGKTAFQLKESYHTDWMEAEALPALSMTALDMDKLYEGLVRAIAGDQLTAPETESLHDAVAQTQEKEKLRRQIEQLKGKMKREKRLAKQMELRREIKRLEGCFCDN